jgi:ADP-heptose:LPS heptosyltransferase
MNQAVDSAACRSPDAATRASGVRRRVVQSCLARLLRAIDAKLCRPGALPAHGIHRILVCRPNHRLGNTVLISPLLCEIEVLYPGAEVDIVGSGGAAHVLFSTRFQVRRVMSFPRRIARHLWTSFSLVRELRRDTYDLAIDACVGSTSARLLLGAARARYKVGFAATAAGNGALRAYDEGRPHHLAKRGVFLLRTAYAGPTGSGWPALVVGLSDAELQRGRCALESILGNAARRPVLGIFANATGAKRHAQAWWIAFVAALRTQRPDLVIVDVLAEHGRSQLPGANASFYSRDLRKLASVLAGMQGFVSADCGVMHLAAAVGVPTLGLFALSNSAKYAPYGAANKAIDTGGMDGTQAARVASGWVQRAVASLQVSS